MRRCDSGVIVFLVIGAVFGQQAKTPQKGSDLSILPGYNLVEWPTQATSAAGFPAGPWNFIQVTAAALSARGNILLLHRGAHPVMEFEPGGKFVSSWGDRIFSEGRLWRFPCLIELRIGQTTRLSMGPQDVLPAAPTRCVWIVTGTSGWLMLPNILSIRWIHKEWTF